MSSRCFFRHSNYLCCILSVTTFFLLFPISAAYLTVQSQSAIDIKDMHRNAISSVTCYIAPCINLRPTTPSYARSLWFFRSLPKEPNTSGRRIFQIQSNPLIKRASSESEITSMDMKSEDRAALSAMTRRDLQTLAKSRGIRLVRSSFLFIGCCTASDRLT